jgi:hypothetical protein
VAVIAIDSSGHVGQPPVFFVAARLKFRRRVLDPSSQRHHIIRVDTELHDTFANRAQTWRLKLSAALIYDVMIGLVHKEDTIIIDTDFDPSNRQIVKRYINKLLSTYNRETPIQSCPIQFTSSRENECVKIADLKTKLARRRRIDSVENVNANLLNDYFNVLMRIH